MVILTKSRYMSGMQCLRLLWHASKKLLPDVSIADQHRFDQGHEFETYVYKLFPKGLNLADKALDFKASLEKTKKAIEDRKTIFEASVMQGEYFIRADILEPVEMSEESESNESDVTSEIKGKWNLYEIKSTTKVKEQHIPDLAFQKFVLEKKGMKINKCFLIFLNKEYVKEGEIDASKLIKKEEVTERVGLIDQEEIKERCQEYQKIISQDKIPPIIISKNCNKPYICHLKKFCWATLPKGNVLELTDWRKYWKLYDDGIIEMKDVPEDLELNAKDRNIKEATIKNEVVILKEPVIHFLKTLVYPLYHFDFETFDTAVPIYNESRPYQKMPFQYSLHIEHEDGKLEHFEYLAQGDEDPRPKLLEQLKGEIEKEGPGSVIVFNKSFETSVLTKLAENFPEHKEWIDKVLGRIIDLAVPFQNFHYYNPCQKGSYSIKKVLPAITDNSYSEMEIDNGGDASALYFYSHIKKTLDEDKRKEIRANLIKYCGLDTEAMVWIIKELKKLVEF
jgi:hypothetical protein